MPTPTKKTTKSKPMTKAKHDARLKQVKADVDSMLTDNKVRDSLIREWDDASSSPFFDRLAKRRGHQAAEAVRRTGKSASERESDRKAQSRASAERRATSKSSPNQYSRGGKMTTKRKK